MEMRARAVIGMGTLNRRVRVGCFTLPPRAGLVRAEELVHEGPVQEGSAREERSPSPQAASEVTVPGSGCLGREGREL